MGVDRLRVAEVWSAAGRVGSGYRVSGRLVLTAAHVIGGAEGEEPPELGVRPLGQGGWLAASLRWVDRGLDAALVRIDAPGWVAPAGESTVRWGQAGGTDPLFCMALGFPWAAERTGGVRDTEQLYGHVAPLGGQVSGLADVNVSSAAPAGRPGQSPWAGMSGAGLVVASDLAGVVLVDPARYGTDRVRARPVADLVAAAGFRRALQDDKAELPAKCEVLGDRWRLRLADGTGLSLAPLYRPLPRTPGPAQLLQPQYGLVPYLGRDDMVTTLVGWCEKTDAYPRWVCVVTGEGGSGKTRLAAEVCTRLLAAGWDAGFSDSPQAADTLRGHLERSTLVVIDDADLRPGLIASFVGYVRADLGGPPARLLLLARHLGDQRDPGGGSAGVGWWAQLNRTLELDGIFEGQLDVSDHPLDPASRTGHYQAALDALRPHVPAPAAGPAASPPALDDPSFGQPLLVHMAALIAAFGDPVPAAAPAGLLRRGPAGGDTVRTRVLRKLLDREAERWQGLAGDLLRFETPLPAQVVALATASAASDRAAATGLLRVVPDLADASGERLGALADWGHRLYAGAAWWNPIRPDPLAEQHLADTPDLSGLVVALAAAVTSDGRGRAGVFRQLLGELTKAAPTQPVVQAALQQLIDGQLPTLVTVCIKTADPALALLVSQALRLCPSPAGAAAVAGQLPDYSLAMADLAAEITAQAVTYHRGLAEARPDAFLPDLAASLTSQSRCLAVLGQREQALAAIEEAVTIGRGLAEARPDAFLPDLAWSLTSQSSCLAALGQRESALAAIDEAVTIRRGLADARPSAFLPGLAASLTSQSVRLAVLDQREQAVAAIEEAVTIRRGLADARPDAFLPDLAASLTSQSSCLAALDQREKALAAIEEAVFFYRGLADARPDAFLPDLARSLTSQCLPLAALGQWEKALTVIDEAVTIGRGLAEGRPDVFLPRLATSLTSQSRCLAALGQREQALAAIEEAVTLYRGLAEGRPDAFLPGLAWSLTSQSSCLAALDQREQALAAIEEAGTIRRGLADARPDAFLPDLATSLTSQSNQLADLGQRESALAAIDEAVTIRRGLADARPDAFLPDLAASLTSQSNRLADLGQRQQALAAIDEAVTIGRGLAGARPDAFLPDLAASLTSQSSCLAVLGQRESALAAIEEAVTIGRGLAGAAPTRSSPTSPHR